jgi:hypothetical protein
VAVDKLGGLGYVVQKTHLRSSGHGSTTASGWRVSTMTCTSVLLSMQTYDCVSRAMRRDSDQIEYFLYR